MTKIIAVTGAAGTQRGGVVNAMKKTPGGEVRAIPRNTSSDVAQKLAAEGIRVVSVDFDGKESLFKALEGVSAVYAVTNWWKHLYRGKSQEESGIIEEEQGMKLARAAARAPTLGHYFCSTCPSAKRLLNGELLTPHMDYKANVDACIKVELPEHYVQLSPTKPDAKVLLSVDMKVNPGIWTLQVIASAPKSFGKYSNVALEKLSFQEMTDVRSEVTGKQGCFIQCSAEDWTKMWGHAGNELELQFKYGELCDHGLKRRTYQSRRPWYGP